MISLVKNNYFNQLSSFRSLPHWLGHGCRLTN